MMKSEDVNSIAVLKARKSIMKKAMKPSVAKSNLAKSKKWS